MSSETNSGSNGRPKNRPTNRQAAVPKVRTILTTSDLSKSYGDRPALEPLSIDVLPGQRVALIGHNGSGKTTLMKMAAGLLSPSTGSITIDGAPAGSETARRALSWLSDTPVFYDDLSLWEHLQYVAGMHDVADWEDRANGLLDRVGLTHRKDDLPLTFSRGLRQKAAITLALIRPFKLLLVDEPFVGLDANGKRALLELFALAATEGATQVVATHELSFVEQSDRLIALRDGVSVWDGPPAEADLHALVQP